MIEAVLSGRRFGSFYRGRARPPSWWAPHSLDRVRPRARLGATTGEGRTARSTPRWLKLLRPMSVSSSPAWTYPTYDNVGYRFGPIVANDVAYVLARNNSLVALDATTGKEIWIHAELQGMAPRGINYWESRDRSDRRLIYQRNGFLEEIDAKTGQVHPDVRQQRRRQSARRAGPRSADDRPDPVAQPRQGLREPDHSRLCAGRGVPLAARRSARV